MIEAMIDIETYGRGERAVVLSVGAVRFTEDGPVQDDESLYNRLTLKEQFQKGREVDEDVVLWWADQDPAAFKEAFSRDRVRTHRALRNLSVFLRDVSVVWANSPSFDLTILGSLYRDFNMSQPWGYRGERDVRTVRAMAGVRRDWTPQGWNRTAHHPVDDCLLQIEVVNHCRRKINLTGLAKPE